MNLRYCITVIVIFTLSALQTKGAASTQSFNWGGFSGLTGVPTPLEEYGLTIGDITTTRIFNPIGQLKIGDSIIIARQIEDSKIVNPWQELTPGTGLIVDGRKAIIRQIQPDKAPESEESGLRIKLNVQEIGGTTMTLEWEQISYKLNWAETAPVREATVKMLKQNLRVGAHLIINGNRRVITQKSIGYTSPTSTDNKNLEFTARYYALEGSKGTLSGKPNPTENLTDAAWRLKDGDFPLANNTAQLLGWKFRSRDNDPDRIPRVTVLHRARGSVSEIKLAENTLAEVHVRNSHEGQIFTDQLSWEQTTNNEKTGSLWQLKSTVDDFVEVLRINDTNIQFSITPDSLIKANQEAADFFKSKKNNTGRNQLSSNILDAEAMANQIKNLLKIVGSDASETIKIDAKRQALIYLARFYEHQADLKKALDQEAAYREKIKLEEARMYERHAWLYNQKMKLLEKENDGIKDLEGTPVTLDLEIDAINIFDAHAQLDQYTHTAKKLSGSSLKSEYALLKGNYEAYKTKAQPLRSKDLAKDAGSKSQRDLHKEQAVKNYSMALQFWSEYIYRTEGLREGDRLRKLEEINKNIKKDLAEMKPTELWKKVDSDESDSLDDDEVRKVMANIGKPFLSDEELTKAVKEMKEMVPDGAKQVSRDDFIEWWNRQDASKPDESFTGLSEGASKLSESGIEGNTTPPDPYLPEIFLRQAWIYRKMGLTDRAISTYYDVLTGATKQKIDNLTRFERIALVARSQIANCFYEDAEDAEDLSEAVNLYQRLLPSDNKELDSSQVELKLLRALFRSDNQALKDARRIDRNFEQLKRRNKADARRAQVKFDKAIKDKEYDNEEEKFTKDQITKLKELHEMQEKEARQIRDGKTAEIEQIRITNWKLLKRHTEQYIDRHKATEPDLEKSGEVLYYQTRANYELGNEQRVERNLEILLENDSAPAPLRQAWLATRVRIFIDIANTFYSAAVIQQIEEGNPSEHVHPEYLKAAIRGYEEALEYDQTYRSQIMLRQQIAFCQELLKQSEDAIKTYEAIDSLCAMHPYDLNPTLKVAQNLAKMKLKNLKNKKNQLKEAISRN